MTIQDATETKAAADPTRAGYPSSARRGPAGRTNVRWLIIFLAFLGTAVSYVDRANLGVAMPYVQKELGLGPAAAGFALGAFFWSYAFFQLPSGWFVDRVGPRVAYTV